MTSLPPFPKKVALIHDHLNQVGGAERVLEAFHELFPEAPVYTLVHDAELTHRRYADWDIRSSFIQRLPGGTRHFKWYLMLMPKAFEAFDLSAYDLVLSDSSAFSKGVRTRPDTLHVSYCHTPTRYLWSDRTSYITELPAPWIVKRTLPYFQASLRLWDELASDRVNTFIANSSFVAQRIFQYYKRESTVLYPPVDTGSFGPAQPVPLDERYLIVARFRPYKRVDLAIDACNRLRIPLDVVGSGEDEARLRKLAGPTIRFLGRVDDLKPVLERCSALLNPQEEDFGITAVEAMAAGRPVIAYRAGGALESVREGVTGTFFEPQTVEGLIEAIRAFRMQDFRPDAIQQHAQTFSRERFLNEMRSFLKQQWSAFHRERKK